MPEPSVVPRRDPATPQSDRPGGAHPPVYFRGAALRAAKRFIDCTHRCAAPEATLDRIRPHCRAAGITRIANITGLDRIGIPVTVVYRPNGRTLSSAAGKGFTLAASTVSGMMEAIEIYHAEYARVPTTLASYADLARTGPVIVADHLPLIKRSLFNPRRAELWVSSWDIASQMEIPVPAASVVLARHPEQKPLVPMPFSYGSNGLASGNDFLEALCAGLLEVIERDAITCHLLAERRVGYRRPRVRLETVEHPLVVDLLHRFRAAGVTVLLYDLTIDTDVPVYLATAYDDQSRHIGIASGFGAHLDPQIAMVRALTEAAQSRLVYIAGARDDVFHHEDLRHRMDDTDAAIASARSTPATADAGARRSQATGSFEGDIGALLSKLARVGLHQVLVVDLTRAEHGIPVVRVIVPGLEGYHSPFYAPGKRALAFCARHAPQANEEHA